jgi:hypothetical protein
MAFVFKVYDELISLCARVNFFQPFLRYIWPSPPNMTFTDQTRVRSRLPANKVKRVPGLQELCGEAERVFIYGAGIKNMMMT